MFIFRLKCIYCELTFRDRDILKEHMRKKFHKRVSPQNTFYDRFYVSSYIEGGRDEEPEDPTERDSWAQWREEGKYHPTKCVHERTTYEI